MSTFILKYITNRILKDNQWNRLGVEDPYYEYVPIAKRNHKTKYRKVNRKIPEGLSETDVKVLNSFRTRAYRYDMWFSFLGVKFGWSNIVGIIPVLGSIVTAYWSLSLLVLANGIDDGLPLDLQLLFLLNILIDFLLGLIPIVGDLIEVGYKSNSRNFLLLEKHLVRVGQKNMGILKEEEVRPNFINDKIQPVVEEKVKPNVSKAGESVKNFIHKHANPQDTASTSSSSSFQPTSAYPTIQTSPTTVTSSMSSGEDASDSIRKRENVDNTD